MATFFKTTKNYVKLLKIRPIAIPQIIKSEYPDIELTAITSLFRLHKNIYDVDITASIKSHGLHIDLSNPLPLEALQRKAYIELYVKNHNNNNIVYDTVGFDNQYSLNNGSLDVTLICTDMIKPPLKNWQRHSMYTFQIYDTKDCDKLK